jgi:hypothetical protein
MPSDSWRTRGKSQLNSTIAPWAFPAVWLLLISATGTVVVSSGRSGTEQARLQDAPGTFVNK